MFKVYLIEAEIDNNLYYKIGYTKREVGKRVNELKTANACNLSIITVFESKWGTKIETSLHKMFKGKKINGEWFYLSQEDVKNFREHCKRIHDNFEMLTTENTYVMDKGFRL